MTLAKFSFPFNVQFIFTNSLMSHLVKFDVLMVTCLFWHLIKKFQNVGGSPGLVVMGED